MLKPLNEGTQEEMCVCTGIFGFSWGFPISDRIRELQLLHTTKKKSIFTLWRLFFDFWCCFWKAKPPPLPHTGLFQLKTTPRVKQRLPGAALFSSDCCVASWISDMEQGRGRRRVWCETQRYRQRFSQFHSAEVVELSTASVRKFFWKRSAKVKETKLAQTGQPVKSLLGS